MTTTTGDTQTVAGKTFSVLFCAELKDGSEEHAGNVSSWQNKPPPRLDTRQNCSNPSRCRHHSVPTPMKEHTRIN